MSKKQAYLLTAYKDFDAVCELASFLCQEDEVFIHIDKKSTQISKEQEMELESIPNCHVYRKYEIAWGGYTHVQALLYLMEKARADRDIAYVHFLTGEDFPLLSPKDLHDRFIEDEHIYLSFIPQKEFNEAVKKRYLYYNWFQNKNVKNLWLWNLQNFTVNLQKLVGVKRTRLGEFEKIYKGLVYMSMPMEAVDDILVYLSEHPEYEKDLYRCQVPEEFFFHTLILNESFYRGKWKELVVDRELRYMNWERGDGSSPVYLDESDFQELSSGNWCFARKFHGKESQELRDKIREELW